jgi:hypothetical protein
VTIYFGDKFSTKSMVGTVVRNRIGVAAIIRFLYPYRKMFLKRFLKPKSYNTYWTYGPGNIYQVDLFSLSGLLKYIDLSVIKKKGSIRCLHMVLQ